MADRACTVTDQPTSPTFPAPPARVRLLCTSKRLGTCIGHWVRVILTKTPFKQWNTGKRSLSVPSKKQILRQRRQEKEMQLSDHVIV